MFAVVLLMPPLLFERRLYDRAHAAARHDVVDAARHRYCMLPSMVSTPGDLGAPDRLPHATIIAILACYLLSIGSSASLSSLHVFFVMIAALVMVGMVAWTLLVQMPYFQDVLFTRTRTRPMRARARARARATARAERRARAGDDDDESSD